MKKNIAWKTVCGVFSKNGLVLNGMGRDTISDGNCFILLKYDVASRFKAYPDLSFLK